MEAPMPRRALKDGFDKHKRFREAQKAKGLRLVRVWLPDPRASEFQAEARRQAALIRGTQEDSDALDFIEAVGDFREE
jgi:hypothetical protein